MIDAAQLPHGARRPTLAEWYLRCDNPWGCPRLHIMAELLSPRPPALGPSPSPWSGKGVLPRSRLHTQPLG